MIKFRKEMSKEFDIFVTKLILRQKDTFYLNDIAKAVERSERFKMKYQNIRVYVGRIIKRLESEGSIIFHKEEQGGGYIMKKLYLVK